MRTAKMKSSRALFAVMAVILLSSPGTAQSPPDRAALRAEIDPTRSISASLSYGGAANPT